MKKIVLLGSTGQLGRDILEVLESTNDKFEVITPKREDLQNLDNLFLNIGSEDYIINTVAMTNTGLCEDEIDQAYKINAFLVYELAKRCSLKDVTLFQISTDYVFDGKKDTEYFEDDRTFPLSIYGASKLTGEDMARAYAPKHFILRVSSLYGVNSKNGNFVETMIKKARQGDDISVVSDQYMSPTHTFDIAQAIFCFIKNDIKEYGVYHVSGDGSCSWYEFALEVFKTFNLTPNVSEVSYKDFPAKLKRPIRAALSNKKTNKIYQMPKWQDSLKIYKKRLEGKV